MARLLLVPVAALALAAGLVGLGLAITSLPHALPPPVPMPLHEAAAGALLAAAPATLLGLAAALAFRRAGKPLRFAACGLALLLLIAPAPGFSATALLHDPSNHAAAIGFACAMARCAALVMLVLAAGLRAVPPGLQRAAILAGARPSQAWRHAVLTPLLPYLAGAAIAGFLLALATRYAVPPAPPGPLTIGWVVPACLLLAAAGTAALAGLLRASQEA